MNSYLFPEFMKTFETIKPLSNFEITDKCKELKIKNFKGVFMRDELKGKSSKNECLILNLDDGSGKGTHWTCLYVNNNLRYYFDSFGLPPPLEILNYCSNYVDIKYSDHKIQKINVIICGQYSIYVLYKLFHGFDYIDILEELYVKNNK